MPFNGSGTFSRVYNWVTEQASSPIEIAKLDTNEDDLASGLSNCILRDGTGLPSTTIPWNSQALTGVSNLSAERVTVTGSTVPANGMYLSAANTVAFASNTTLRGSVNSAGQWSIAPPTSGTAFTINGLAGQIGLQVAGDYQGNWPLELTSTGGATTGRVAMSFVRQGGTNKQWAIGNNPDGASDNAFGIRDITRGVIPFSIASAGNVVIAAPSSGTTLALSGTAGTAMQTWSDGTQVASIQPLGSSAGYRFGTVTGHALGIYTNDSARISIASAGNVTIAAPSSGTALVVTGVSGQSNMVATDGTANSAWQSLGASGTWFGTTSAHNLVIGTGGTNRLTINTSGNVTINAASSGDELTVIGSVVATSFAGALTGNVTGDVSGSSGSCTGNAATATALQNARTINGTSFNGTANITITAAADTLTGTTLAALSGANLTALNATQLTSGTVPAARIGSSTDYAIGDGSTVNSIQIGFRGIPQNSQTTNYTCVLADAGKHVLHPSGGGSGDTFTIPANSSVAYAIGTTITFVNADSNALSIAITTDTMTLAGTSTTGTRTLSLNGVATAIKVGTTSWIISGSGLS